MNKILLLILCAVFSNSTFAKDSDWRLCVGEVTIYEEKVSLVVNLYEHRNGSDGRATELTLIYGGNVLKGGFNSTESDSGTVILKNDDSFFRGTATANYVENNIILKGRLSLFGSVTPLNAIIKCEILGN